MVKAIASVEGSHVVVGDARFKWQFPMPDDEGLLPVIKADGVLWEYEELCRSLEPRRIVELGIHRGGSTAFLNELAEPERIVALELNTTPAEPLSSYIAERGLGDVVRPHYGVDQADRERLRAIMRDEFGESPLDLVVDDASHLYAQTRASFETLFPLLRPGGVYVIEDWAAGHRKAHAAAAALRNPSPEQLEALDALLKARAQANAPAREPEPPPLARLAHELLLVRTMRTEVARSVRVTRWWTAVTRGTDPLDADTFRLDDHFQDPFGLLGGPSPTG
jgi:predicted O-methyltransferase YrrM